MKRILFALTILLFASNANAQHTQHFKDYAPGGYWVTNANLQDGDTLHMIKGVYSYISGENLTNVTIFPDPGTEMTSGINLRNSSNIHIAGLSANGSHNLYIHNASGIAIEGTGMCNNWEIDGVDEYNVYSWIWWKTEPDDFKINGVIDSSYWHIVMSNLYVHDCNWKKANFDGGYIGTTDAKADRGFVINSITYYPYPTQVSRIRFKNMVLDTAYRTNLQVSVLLDSVTLDNVRISNGGINSYLDADGKNQGANFIIGGSRNSIYATITNSTFKNSNLYNIRTQAGGVIVFKNNTTDSATAVYRIGQGTGINNQQMASVEFDNPIPTLLDIENNNIGYSNNNVGIVLYGQLQSGSKYAGNTLKGQLQNFTGTSLDTTSKDTVVVTPPPPDTTVLYYTLDATTNTATFYRKDQSTTVFQNVQRCVGAILKKGLIKWTVFYINGSNEQVK